MMTAKMEPEQYADPKYGQLVQLSFVKASEVQLVDDGYKADIEDEHHEEPKAARDPSKVLMLQEILNGYTEGNF